MLSEFCLTSSSRDLSDRLPLRPVFQIPWSRRLARKDLAKTALALSAELLLCSKRLLLLHEKLAASFSNGGLLPPGLFILLSLLLPSSFSPPPPPETPPLPFGVPLLGP